MKLKLDTESGHAILQDGKVIVIGEDGKETPVDVPALMTSVKSRAEQSARVETENKALKEKLKGFEGIEDPEAARKALETVQNLDHKKLVDAGEVEKVKAEISKSFQTQLDTEKARAQKLEAELYSEKIGGRFSRSKFIADKLAIPADLVQARFGTQFKIEEGKITPYDAHGNKIYSKSNPGEMADFDEALELITEQYPYKDTILKGSAAQGGGARGGTAGGATDWKNLPPEERMAIGRKQRR